MNVKDFYGALLDKAYVVRNAQSSVTRSVKIFSTLIVYKVSDFLQLLIKCPLFLIPLLLYNYSGGHKFSKKIRPLFIYSNRSNTTIVEASFKFKDYTHYRHKGRAEPRGFAALVQEPNLPPWCKNQICRLTSSFGKRV